MLDRMRRQTEDLIRYYGELNRRVAHSGLEGIPGLLQTTNQVEAALAAVSSQEIDWMVREVRVLLEQLVRIDAQVQQLRDLKMEMDGDGAGNDPGIRTR
jgi:hypothetical protein